MAAKGDNVICLHVFKKKSIYQEAQASWSSIKNSVTRGVGFDMIS